MKRGEERGREEKKSGRREERKEISPPPPVTHARVPESNGERRRCERETVEIGGEKEEKREREGERERERREEERKIVREGEAISPSRDEERRRKSERGEEEREKRGEERNISPSCYARAQPGGQKRGATSADAIRKPSHLSGNADVVPQSGHRKRWCHNLDLK